MSDVTTAYHYAAGASERVGMDRDDLVEDLVSNGFNRENAEKGVDRLIEEENDE